jgi:hypothetical protein
VIKWLQYHFTDYPTAGLLTQEPDSFGGFIGYNHSVALHAQVDGIPEGTVNSAQIELGYTYIRSF